MTTRASEQIALSRKLSQQKSPNRKWRQEGRNVRTSLLALPLRDHSAHLDTSYLEESLKHNRTFWSNQDLQRLFLMFINLYEHVCYRFTLGICTSVKSFLCTCWLLTQTVYALPAFTSLS